MMILDKHGNPIKIKPPPTSKPSSGWSPPEDPWDTFFLWIFSTSTYLLVLVWIIAMAIMLFN